MSRSSKRRFTDEIITLLSSVSTRPQTDRILVSRPLCDALVEILSEVNRPRTNWHLVAALTGVKSYITGVGPDRIPEDPFWERECGEGGPSVYRTLDELHLRAAMKANVLPSGLSVFTGTADGVEVRHGEVDTTASAGSPTLRLIAGERARIESGRSPVTGEAADD